MCNCACSVFEEKGILQCFLQCMTNCEWHIPSTSTFRLMYRASKIFECFLKTLEQSHFLACFMTILKKQNELDELEVRYSQDKNKGYVLK